MSSIFNNFFKQIARGDQIRDFKHASRLFVDNNFALSPKYSWLYHVYFDLNPELSKINDTNRLTEHGMLVKSVELPKFSIASKTFNEYNRPNIIQTKVNYDQVQIVFHDDQSDVIRDLWYDYYTYYYRDADIGYGDSTGGINPTYFAPSKYEGGARNLLNRFGYTPRRYDGRLESQYIQAIRIYSLHQKKFSEYTLVNPYITSFKHGRHDANPGSEVLDHTMTIAYETVLYASGYVTKNTVKGFADLHYDKSPSPLTPQGGGTNSIMGPGGILDAADTIFRQGLAGGVKGYGAAAFTLLRATEKNKNVDLRGLAKTELVQAGMDILNGKNPLDRTFIPNIGSTTTNKFPGIASAPGLSSAAPGSVVSNGSSVNIVGTATAAAGILGFGSAKLTNPVAGASTNTNGQLSGGTLNQVLNVNADKTVASSGSIISFDFLSKALVKEQEKKKAQQQAEAQKASSGYAEAAATTAFASKELPQGISPTASIQQGDGVSVFTTGTNSTVNVLGYGVTTNVLGQAPGSGGIIPASIGVASKQAESYITNGNPVQLTPQPRNGTEGSSTPVIPA